MPAVENSQYNSTSEVMFNNIMLLVVMLRGAVEVSSDVKVLPSFTFT